MADLDSYLHRIGYQGPREATLSVLEALHRLHPREIPFENLDPFLGRPVRLEGQAIEGKLVRSCRGGYCYEHNLLFMDVLRSLGFQVSGLAARVLWGYDEDALTRRSHMLLRVELDGRTLLADVGFGGSTPTAPLELAPGAEQQTPHERFRIVAAAGLFRVQALLAGAWRSLYAFDLSEHIAADYEVASYFMSTNPSSPFRSSLILARALPGRRLACLGNRLSVHHPDGGTERRSLRAAGELADTVEQAFGIAIPDRSAFESAVAEKGILETVAVETPH